MSRKLVICLAAIALALALGVSESDASFEHFRLLRRQSGEGEQESTTPKQEQQSQQPKPPTPDGGGRLYPDLSQRPNFLPPFTNGGPPTPFVPYGVHLPNRLDADQPVGPFGRLPPQPRPMTPMERLQSQSFTSGLGKRLLSMIGVGTEASNNQTETVDQPLQRSDQSPMRLLQNSTLLQELNKRVNQVMGGLGKMYNSTVQEQLNLLDERFKKEAGNSTNPWHQRVSQQASMFFKQMTGRVAEAQEQLNRVWRDVAQVAQGNSSLFDGSAPSQGQPRGRFFGGAFDQFISPNGDGEPPGGFFGNGQNGGDFVNQLSRSFSMSPEGTPNQQQNASSMAADLGARLREFWHVQVQPQVGQLRQQIARTWRDLTSSGALTPEAIMRSRSNGNNLAAGNPRNASSPSAELVDNILKELDTEGSEYSLVQPKSSDGGESAGQGEWQRPKPMATLSPQMQNRLMEMQRELNQLWMGLSSSLQSAVRNVRNTLNPRPPQFSPMSPQQQEVAEADPAQNEIDGKIKDLTNLQQEADVVHDLVKQQQQREMQQRQAASLGDRFRGFINNVDTRGLNHLPDRIGEQFNRFGTAMGNFWNTIPERWDNLMTSARQQEMQARMKAQVGAAQSSSTTPTTPISNQ